MGPDVMMVDGNGKRDATLAGARAEAMAAVQARYVMARHRPRDIDDFRARLLRDCQRPGFAAVAIYELPRAGKTIEGPSIRFVEAALRHFGNTDTAVIVTRDDEEVRGITVQVVDLETNTSYARETVLRKVTERRRLREGEQPLSVRKNTKGDTVYIVPATDEDLANVEGAAASKSIRTNGLRLLPGDIVEEALAAIRKTQEDRAAQDPDGERKRLADGFAALNILPSDLKDYLGHALEQTSPVELTHLRKVYVAVREGDITWAEARAAKAAKAAAKPGPDEPPRTLDDVVARRRAGKSKKAQGAAAKKPEATPAATKDAAPADPEGDGR